MNSGMKEVEMRNCPFCDAAQHKIIACYESTFFYKECSSFFDIKQKHFQCQKCKNFDIIDSDFPSPSGELVFQCNKCKKMYGAKEFFEFNVKLGNK
jgi:hypothetical protein